MLVLAHYFFVISVAIFTTAKLVVYIFTITNLVVYIFTITNSYFSDSVFVFISSLKFNYFDPNRDPRWTWVGSLSITEYNTVVGKP